MPRREQKTNSKSYFHRGSEGRSKSVEVREEQKRRQDVNSKKGRLPFRFWVPVGETREIIIVDERPDFFAYEHNIKLNGKWGNTFLCIDEWDSCPICSEVGPSYYGMFLTIIDLTPFKDRNGVEHEFSRKLMVVKPSQHKKFLRDAERRGSLRGAIYECSRDGPKDPAVGNDIQFLEDIPEEELLENYISEWTDKEGKVHTENIGEAPINYEEMFGEPPTNEELRAIVGGTAPSGSKHEHDQEFKDDKGKKDDWDDDDDDTPWDDDEKEEEKPKRATRTTRTTRSSRGSSRSTTTSSRRSRDEPDEEEETPKRKPRRVVGRR